MSQTHPSFLGRWLSLDTVTQDTSACWYPSPPPPGDRPGCCPGSCHLHACPWTSGCSEVWEARREAEGPEKSLQDPLPPKLGTPPTPVPTPVFIIAAFFTFSLVS